MDEDPQLHQLRQMALQSMPNNQRNPMMLKQHHSIRGPAVSTAQLQGMNPMMPMAMSQHSGLYQPNQQLTSMMNQRLPLTTTALMGTAPLAPGGRIRGATMATPNIMRNAPTVTNSMMGTTPMMTNQILGQPPNPMMGNPPMMTNPMMTAPPNQMMSATPNQMMGKNLNQMMGGPSGHLIGAPPMVNPHSLPPPPPPPGPPPQKASAMPYSVLGKMPSTATQYTQQPLFKPQDTQSPSHKILSHKKKHKHEDRTPTQSESERSSSTSRSRSWSRSRSRTRSHSSFSSRSGSRSSYGHSPSASGSSRSRSRSQTRSHSYSDSESVYSSRSSSKSPSPVRKSRRKETVLKKKKQLVSPPSVNRKDKRRQLPHPQKHKLLRNQDSRRNYSQSPSRHTPRRRPHPEHSRVHHDQYHRRPPSSYNYNDIHSSSISPRKRKPLSPPPDAMYRGRERYGEIPESLKDRLAPRHIEMPPKHRDRHRHMEGPPQRMRQRYTPEYDHQMMYRDRRHSPLPLRHSRTPSPVLMRRRGRGDFTPERRNFPSPRSDPHPKRRYSPPQRHKHTTLASKVVSKPRQLEPKKKEREQTNPHKETQAVKSPVKKSPLKKSPQKKPVEVKSSSGKEESEGSKKKATAKEDEIEEKLLDDEKRKDADSANESIEEGERVSTSPSVSPRELPEDKETGDSVDARVKASLFGEGEDAIEFSQDYDEEFAEELDVSDEGGAGKSRGLTRRRISSPIRVSPSAREGLSSFSHSRQDRRGGRHNEDIMPNLPKDLARRLGPKRHRNPSSQFGGASAKGSAEEIARRHRMEKDRQRTKRSDFRRRP